MTDLFRFSFQLPDKPLKFIRTEIIAAKQWDHVFYQGDFDSDDHDEIRCVVQCPQCYKSWFNIGVNDFKGHRIADLVKNGLLDQENITNYKIAEIIAKGDFVLYKTMIGGPAEFVITECNRCHTRHFIVLSVTEIQPTRYAAAMNGCWLIHA